MKYIMFLDTKTESHIPIIFPNRLVHQDVAEHLDFMLLRHDIEVELVSAGFWNKTNGCHGKSETLDLESREIDTEIIASMDYRHGLI